LPYFKKIFASFDAKIRFLHNDADGIITAGNLNEMGVNMFNFSYRYSLGEIRELAGEDIILVGNIPPRDVMASGTPSDVEEAVGRAFGETDSHDKIIWSVGGGMPPDVRDENIDAFIRAVRENNQIK
jgi:uroporphyrinogen decarboxylase